MREETELDKLYEDQIRVLKNFQKHKDCDENNVINRQIIKLCNELDAIRTKEITGNIENNGNNIHSNTK